MNKLEELLLKSHKCCGMDGDVIDCISNAEVFVITFHQNCNKERVQLNEETSLFTLHREDQSYIVPVFTSMDMIDEFLGAAPDQLTVEKYNARELNNLCSIVINPCTELACELPCRYLDLLVNHQKPSE